LRSLAAERIFALCAQADKATTLADAAAGTPADVRVPAKYPTKMTSLEKLKLFTAWTDEPVLTEDELEDVLAETALTDGGGKTPETEGWTPTYDINKAASEAWLIKAARAAAMVEVDPPESGIVTSKVFDNCRRMARLYADRRSGTTSILN
jgi:hypothetical protein